MATRRADKIYAMEPPTWTVGSQSRRSGFGNLVAKHPPFSFNSHPLHLVLKGVQKMRTTMRREKKTDNIYHRWFFHGGKDERE